MSTDDSAICNSKHIVLLQCIMILLQFLSQKITKTIQTCNCNSKHTNLTSTKADASTRCTIILIIIIKKKLKLIIVMVHKVARELYIVSEKVSADALSPVWQ